MSTSMIPSTSPSTKADLLRTTALRFCEAFGAGIPGTGCLDKFFTANPTIVEHGPRLAVARLPFLATLFTGRKQNDCQRRDTCDHYYELLTSTLALVPGSLQVPLLQQVAVDAENGIVTVSLHATFKSVKTGKAWNENFVYLLSEFDEEGRIGKQELWADPLSAWLAVGD